MRGVEREYFLIHTHLRISRVGTVCSRSARVVQLASVMPALLFKLMVDEKVREKEEVGRRTLGA